MPPQTVTTDLPPDDDPDAGSTAGTADSADPEAHGADLEIAVPTMADGAAMWRVARDSAVLDLNTSYAYLLLARDFADTCRVARVGGEVCGFVLGYRRPRRPGCLFVWQIAVDESHRGRGISARLLDAVVDGADPAVTSLETTVTADNVASRALFAGFARRRGADLTVVPLLTAGHFPDPGHDAEDLHRIGPLGPPTHPTTTFEGVRPA